MIGGLVVLLFIMGGLLLREWTADASPAADIETMRKAAEAGDADAQYDLGLMYHDGEGVPEDYVEAVKWFRKAAEQGHAAAQFYLGIAYHGGVGVPKDDAEAVKWLRKAAEQGHARAQFYHVVVSD